jgi:hypothetical protein
LTSAVVTTDEVFSSDNCAQEGVTISTAAKRTIKGILDNGFILSKIKTFAFVVTVQIIAINVKSLGIN